MAICVIRFLDVGVTHKSLNGLVMAVTLMIEGYTATDAVQLIRQQRGEQALFNSDFVERLIAYSRQEHNFPN